MTAAAGAALFEDDAALAAALPGYRSRAGQAEMAVAVARGDGRKRPTGGGGRYGHGQDAGLSAAGPRLASQGDCVDGHPVSADPAGTRRTCRWHRPSSGAACIRPCSRVARTTCVCTGSNLAENSGDLYLGPRLRKVREWAGRTKTGDIGEFGDPGDGDSLWPRITSTTENCLGTDCPLYDKCWVLHARREAQAADLVIANHYLLFADMTVREAGFGEVLPGADAIVLDEAHKLPDIAGRFFGQAVSSRQLRDLVRDGACRNRGPGRGYARSGGAFRHPRRTRKRVHRRSRAGAPSPELARDRDDRTRGGPRCPRRVAPHAGKRTGTGGRAQRRLEVAVARRASICGRGCRLWWPKTANA